MLVKRILNRDDPTKSTCYINRCNTLKMTIILIFMIEPDIIGKFYRYKQRSEDENGILIDDSFPISEAARKNSNVFATQKTRRPRINTDVSFSTVMDDGGSMRCVRDCSGME